MMEYSKRNGAIEFLRFVFCMVVVICHGRNLGGTPEIALFADAGYIAVEFFFFVSGFLMAKSVAKRQNEDCIGLGRETVLFIWKKIKAILVIYVFAVFFSYTRMVITGNFTFKETIRNLMLGVWDLVFLRAAAIKTYGLIRATWYLSAMYIAMLALYPMLRRWKDKFTYIIAPLIALFCLGYISQSYGNLNQYVNNYRLVYAGILRAFADLSIGCICYEVCEKIKTVRFTRVSQVLITLVQFLGYSGVIYCTTNLPVKQFDFVMLLGLAVCVPLTFSGQGILTPFFQKGIFMWLGKMSLIIYLNHMWVKDGLAALFPASVGYWVLMFVYIICVFSVSIICLVYAEVADLVWRKYRRRIRSVFFIET